MSTATRRFIVYALTGKLKLVTCFILARAPAHKRQHFLEGGVMGWTAEVPWLFRFTLRVQLVRPLNGEPVWNRRGG
jgi:hypothetical protein